MSSSTATALGWLSKVRARLGAETWVVLSLVFVAVGFWLRSRRFFISTIAFWNDEANWAIQLVTKPVMAPSIRPVGFVAVSKWLAQTFGPTEVALRFLPWLASIGASVIAIPLAKRLFRTPAARLFFVAVLALHPLVIDLGKEFKPYTLSLFIHLCCLWLVIVYWDTGKRRFLASAIAVPLIGVLFAQDVVFVLPALYLALGFSALRARRHRHLLLIGLGVLSTLALLAALYWFFWKYVTGPTGAGRKQVNGLSSAWWSAAYDLFYPGKISNESRVSWLFRKWVELVSFGGERRDIWTPIGPLSGERLATVASMDTLLWTLLSFVGLACLIFRRRGRELLLLVLPVLVVFVFNALKVWPLGAFRSDLFLLAYTPAWVAAAFDFERTASEKRVGLWRQAVPTVALVLVPLLAFERTWHHHKSGGGEFIKGVNALIDLQGKDYNGGRETLILDGYLCVVWRYYQLYHPGHRELFRDLNHRFRKQCVKPWTQPVMARAKHVPGRERFWLLLAKNQEMQLFTDGAPRGYQVLASRDIEQGQTLAVALRRR
ncbi:MAG TPA: glycosyltransferase family 39 protein [Polyangiaceae bacterium]|nr:glycosyltransferase family 39 protein [Polyangiaceae bacterium]